MYCANPTRRDLERRPKQREWAEAGLLLVVSPPVSALKLGIINCLGLFLQN